jgi:hypothetical protein
MSVLPKGLSLIVGVLAGLGRGFAKRVAEQGIFGRAGAWVLLPLLGDFGIRAIVASLAGFGFLDISGAYG